MRILFWAKRRGRAGDISMVLLSLFGRLLLASFFLLSASQLYNEFGVDGGPTAKLFAPKAAVIQNFLTFNFRDAPTLDARHFVAACISLNGLGGLLFIFGSRIGAHLLIHSLVLTTPILYDFYNYDTTNPEYEALSNDFLQSVALLGGLILFIGLKNSELILIEQIKKKTARLKID